MFSLSEENYLKSIFHLQTISGKGISTSAIAKKLDTKPSSVTDMIKKLEGIIDERAASTNTDSYIVSLFNKGVKEIAKKVNEEAGETAISAVTNDGRIIEEAADLVFHLLVLLRSQNKTMKDITDKLYERSINQ